MRSFKWALLCLFLALPIGVLTHASHHYRKDLLYLSRLLARSLVLDAIALVVTVHDPAVAAVEAPLGPAPGHSAQAFALEGIQLLELTDATVTPGAYRFGYQTASDPRIVSLRQMSGVDRIVTPGAADFPGIVALMNWVNDRWRHGTSGAGNFDPQAFDARSILEHASRGERFWCHVAAMTFIQLASAGGVQGRLVSLSRDGYSAEHAVTEVWSNEKRKWVVMDPDFNVWYSKDGVPLNALEVHDLVLAGQTDRVVIHRGINRPLPEYERRINSLFEFYRYFRVDMRNDWLTNRYFPGHPARSDRSTVFWRDGRVPPVLNLETKVSDPRLLYWELNKTGVTLARRSAGNIVLQLATVTPDFSFFELACDDGTVRRTCSTRIDWPLHQGVNSLTVRSVNRLGQQGIPAKVRVRVL